MSRDDLAARVRRVAMTTTVVAVLCLGLPLAVAARLLVVDDDRSEVERTAATAAVRLSVDPPSGADLPELPATEPGTVIGYYGPDGSLRVGQGPPSADPPTQRAANGSVTTEVMAWGVGSITGDGAIAAAPVTDGARVVGVVRVASGAGALWWRSLAAWAALAAAAGVAVAVARRLATRAAARMAAPLQSLRDAAVAVGDGDLTRRSAPSGIREVDDVAAALDVTAARLGDQLVRERALGAAASHQLRTPVMRLQLLLDAARAHDRRPAGAPFTAGGAADLVAQAAEEAADLTAQLDDLLRLTRDGPGGPAGSPVDLLAVLDDLERRHAPLAAERSRRLVVGSDPDLPPATASRSALGHALDVLVDNALEHGQHTVRVWAREIAGSVAIDVSDEGHGFEGRRETGVQGSGLGLELARALVEAQSGRLVLPGPEPSSRVSIMLNPSTRPPARVKETP